MGQGASRGAPSRDMALDMAALGAPQVVSGRDLGRDPGRGPRGPSHAWGAPSGDVPGGVPCGEPTGVSGAAAAAAHVLASLPAEARARALQRRAVETAGCSRDPSRERRPSTAAALPPPPFFFSSAGASRRASDGAGAAGWAGAATSGGSGGGAYRREARHRDWQRREGGTGPTIGTVHTVSGATVIAACGSPRKVLLFYIMTICAPQDGPLHLSLSLAPRRFRCPWRPSTWRSSPPPPCATKPGSCGRSWRARAVRQHALLALSVRSYWPCFKSEA